MNVSGCTLWMRCILHYPQIDPARKTCLPDKRRVRNIQHGPTGVQTRQGMERRIQRPQIEKIIICQQSIPCIFVHQNNI